MNILQKAIEQHGPERIAEIAEVCQSTVYHWQRGRKPSSTVCKKVASFLGVELEDLLLQIGVYEKKTCDYCKKEYLGNHRGKYCREHYRQRDRRRKGRDKIRHCRLCGVEYKAIHHNQSKCRPCMLEDVFNYKPNENRGGGRKHTKKKTKTLTLGKTNDHLFAGHQPKTTPTPKREILDVNWRPDSEVIQSKVKEFLSNGGQIKKLEKEPEIPYFSEFGYMNPYETVDGLY